MKNQKLYLTKVNIISCKSHLQMLHMFSNMVSGQAGSPQTGLNSKYM